MATLLRCVLWLGCSLILPVEPEAPQKLGGKCSTAGCHEDLTKRPVVHPPIAGQTCDACHEPKAGDEHRFGLVKDQPALCTECHDEFRAKHIHQPLAAGQCTACHDPHGGKAKGLLTAGTVAELCTQCHEEVVKEREYMHGPVSSGLCTVCHQPHASDQSALLSFAERSLCLECHSDFEEKITDSKHLHQPVRDGCGGCHDPHGAEHRFLLKGAPAALCSECHDEIATLAKDAPFKHSPVLTDAACLTCHDPHAAGHSGLLVKPSPDLCLSCHDEELVTERGPVRNLGRHLKENPVHHGPINQGDCMSCHNPHGGERGDLLVQAFPDRLYRPYREGEYALCFQCHDATAFEERETDSATGFRNGERNLHFVHVNQSAKGRTCRACHDPHAAKSPKLIVERVPFGKWHIPIHFTLTATGGSCLAGCHKPQRYDRETPAVYREKP